MSNEDGSVWVTYNGEFYDFQPLREDLLRRGHVFKSRTDTETIVHAYEEWGLELVHRMDGIYAFALWDKKQRCLHIVRDRFGVKPLYYVLVGSRLLFSSEIKSLLCDPEVPCEVDQEALVVMANYRYCPEPITLFKGIRKLPPAHTLTITENDLKIQPYYKLGFIEPDAEEDITTQSDALQDALRRATNRQMIADVEVGFFLSGGIDSSTLLSLARARDDGNRFKTFTIGFRSEDQKGEGQPDDLKYARRVSEMFECDHREIILSPNIIDSLPKVIWHLDEPVADPAAISSYLICEQAKEHGVKVLQSGQGGDEVFCGYPWHLGAHLGLQYRKIPLPVRSGIERMLRLLPATRGGRLTGTFRRLRKFSASASLDFEPSLLGFLSYAGAPELRGLFGNSIEAHARGELPHKYHSAFLSESKEYHYLNRLLHLDTNTFLPSLNLNYTDKTSMAFGVEVRVPLIDREIVEFMAIRSTDLKINGRNCKVLLKKAMEGVIPNDLIYRKKAGFGAPIRSWVKHDLREMIEDLLSERQIRNRGFFDPAYVTNLIGRNRSGQEDFNYLIYFLLSFELWCRQFMDSRPQFAA